MTLSPFASPYIRELHALESHLAETGNLRGRTFQNIDFSKCQIPWEKVDVMDAIFLGCTFPTEEIELLLRKKGAVIFQPLNHLPYNPYRKMLYSWQELMQPGTAGTPNTRDWDIYNHFYQTRFNPDIREALTQRIHDHAIEHALREMLEYDDEGMTKRKCVGFMGGHGALRTDEFFLKTAICAKLLADQGYFVVSGGGPGIMEAANLGGWFAGRELAELEDAIIMLSQAPHYTSPGYTEAAREVLVKYPNGGESLAIPTWFYGHEPSNLFATHIAKLFSNSIREDSLLAICLFGVVFAPGSAGTTQEIFQDAAQNHYATHGYHSPMAFLGRKRYQIDTLVFPLLRQLAWDTSYSEMLFISDSPEEVADFIKTHPPIKK